MRLRERPVATILTRSSSLLSFCARAKSPQCLAGQLCLRGQRLHGTWLGEEEKDVRTSTGEEGEDTRDVRSRGDLSAINFNNFNGGRDNGSRLTRAINADDSTCRRLSSAAESIWKRWRFEPSSPSSYSSAATSLSENSSSRPGQSAAAAAAEEAWQRRVSPSPSSLNPPLTGRGCKNSWEKESEGWLWRRLRTRESAADFNPAQAQMRRWHGGCRFFSVGIGFSSAKYGRGGCDDVADKPARSRRGALSVITGLGPSSLVKDVSLRHHLCGNHGGSGAAATCLSWANVRGYVTESREEKDAVRQSYRSDIRESGGGIIRGNGARPGRQSQNGICSSRVGGTDGTMRGWFERNCPAKIWPYIQLARLDRPIGTWLLTWPCFWSISLAAPPGTLPDLKMLALFGMGAVLLRGVGCTVNDLLDRDIDRKVSRTSTRPLASGAVTQNQAVVFLGSQLLLGLGILLQLNQFSQILGASSLLLVGTYPLMKRYTYWPQAFLGLTINWGALLGWAAVHGSLDPFVITPLYFSCFTWTVVYDTIYAHQDKFDDVQVGVKSTALRFGEATPMWLTGFSGATIGGLICVGQTAGLGWGFYPALIVASSHLAWQTQTVDINNRADCLAKFVSNKWFGGIVFAGTVLGKLTA